MHQCEVINNNTTQPAIHFVFIIRLWQCWVAPLMVSVGKQKEVPTNIVYYVKVAHVWGTISTVFSRRGSARKTESGWNNFLPRNEPDRSNGEWTHPGATEDSLTQVSHPPGMSSLRPTRSVQEWTLRNSLLNQRTDDLLQLVKTTSFKRYLSKEISQFVRQSHTN